MSTKTTFKRIALVAVAALGLGVLSVAPSSASTSATTVTVTNGSATLIAGGASGANSDSTTAAVISVSSLLTAVTDTVTVSFFQKTIPTTVASQAVHLGLLDTTTSTLSQVSKTQTLTSYSAAGKLSATLADTLTAGQTFAISGSSAGYVGASFALALDSATTTTLAGTYTYSVVVSEYSTGVTAPVVTSRDVSIVVAALATASKTGSTGTSSSVLSAGSSYAPATAGVDDVVSAIATASSTAVAILRVIVKNAAGGFAQESITATITGAGVIGDGTTFGKSVVLKSATAAAQDLQIRADGSAGTGTITVSTPNVTFSPKTITFYAQSPKTITASINNPVLNVGTNASAVKATAVDANGNAWTGQLYIVAATAADALVGGSATAPVPCTWTPAYAVHYCPITTLIAGTANFKVVDQSLALGTETAYGAAMTAASSAAVVATVRNSEQRQLLTSLPPAVFLQTSHLVLQAIL